MLLEPRIPLLSSLSTFQLLVLLYNERREGDVCCLCNTLGRRTGKLSPTALSGVEPHVEQGDVARRREERAKCMH